MDETNKSPGNVLERLAAMNAESRKECDARGYHRVIQDSEEPVHCYDCDLWFHKDQDVHYRVVPRSDN